MLNPATLPGRQQLVELRRGRSTKAGMLNPATPPIAHVAQERAGRSTKAGMLNPATLVAQRQIVDEHIRSTKAGMLNPATLPHAHPRHELAALRSTKAGMLNPATPAKAPTSRRTAAPSLNEGRDVKPGDTCRLVPTPVRTADAQRRPGC